MKFVDASTDITFPLNSPKARPGPRNCSGVTNVCVHQTYVLGGFGVGARALAAHNGDAAAARRTRYLETPYHAIYSPADDCAIQLWPWAAYTYHGNGANATSIGFAIDGAWEHPDGDDRLDVESARAALAWAVERARTAGAPIGTITAHRQHHASRARDPGAYIWRNVAQPVAAALGLAIRPGHTTGTGLALPAPWTTPPKK